MRGSKALKLLIYCLWSIFVIRMHARWLELQWFFQMLENIGCKENLSGSFASYPGLAVSCRAALAARSIVWAGGRCQHCFTTQPAGHVKDAAGQNPLKDWSGLSRSHAEDRTSPSDRHARLSRRQWGALPAGGILPLILASLQASGTTVRERRMSLLAALTIEWF